MSDEKIKPITGDYKIQDTGKARYFVIPEKFLKKFGKKPTLIEVEADTDPENRTMILRFK